MMKHRCRYPHPHRFSNTEAMRLGGSLQLTQPRTFHGTTDTYVRIFLECEKLRSNKSTNVLLRKSVNGIADFKTR